MSPQEIRDAVAASPELQALAAPELRDYAEIARRLSEGLPPRVVSRMTTSRGLAEHMPGGPAAAEVVLMKLEAARDAMLASSDQATKVQGSLLRRQLAFLSGDGLDFGSPALRAMLDQFQLGGILTGAEVAGLKAIAEVQASLNWSDVEHALNGGS